MRGGQSVMWRRPGVLGTLLLCLSFMQTLHGQLDTADKQALLDLHNELRGSVGGANILQSVWDEELAATAQAYSEECHFGPNPSVTTSGGVRRGENLGFTATSAVREGTEEVVRGWQQAQDASYTQLVWWNVSAIGCGSFNCPRLSLAGGGRRDGVQFLVCYYLTVFIAGQPPFSPGEKCSDCRDGYPFCDSNGLCATSPSLPVVDDNTVTPPPVTRRLYWLSPSAGSVGGGTRVTLRGQGFSADQYTGGNEVYFQSGSTLFPCDVIPYYSTTTQIVCDTRPSPGGLQLWYSLLVRVRDGAGSEWEEAEVSCGSRCFQYQNGWTPWIESLNPLAGEPSSLLTISGRIFTVAFDDTPEDTPADIITRLQVGGRLCDHVDESGEMYGAALTSSIRGYVTCLTNTTNIIDSMNVSVLLETRGRSHVRLTEYIIGIDNQLRPYSYQTHADILRVSPASGSVEGGTTITVETSINLNNYEKEDVKVYVGGRPCEDVALVGSGSIQCRTPPQPPSLPYYPGGRGLLREVWIGGNVWLIDEYLTEPRSENSAPQERAYRDNSDPREFSERYYFNQRWSGFFVPPVTSLYTFSIISDDLSRLYISPSMDEGEKQLVAYANSHTSGRWDLFETQTAAPVMMEQGRYYYMEAYSNQGLGPWYLGISAKVHSLPYNTYPYNGDREYQRIVTSSTVVVETHAVHLSVSPAVYDLTVLYTEPDSMAMCEITVAVGDNTVAAFPATTASDLQLALNNTPAIQAVGGVTVKKWVGQLQDRQWVMFRIIFQTGMGIRHNNIPPVTVDTNSSCSVDYSIRSGFSQNLTTPTFWLGFPNSPRQTRPLPVVNTSAAILQEELLRLLSYECTRETPPDVLVDEGYEEEDEVEVGVAFCGDKSQRNPTVIWSAGNGQPFSVNSYTHFCFAYSAASLPALSVAVHYYKGQERVGTDITYSLQNCPDWSVQLDSMWHHTCVDMRSCLTGYDPEGQMFQIEQVAFASTGSAFWVDEVAIAAGAVTVTQTAVPVSPANIRLASFSVAGGYLSPPTIILPPLNATEDEGSSAAGLGSGFDSIPMFSTSYQLILASFEISYIVNNCEVGLPLLFGSYDNQDYGVIVERLTAGSPAMSGTFDLSFNGRTIQSIAADTSAATLDQLLEENFPEEGGFTVTSSGGCEGRLWNIQWETRGGDVPSMEVNGTALEGNDPAITVVTIRDGGMWLRPLRADMLRLPELAPQVEVVINDIPSSCKNGSCTFNYSSEATPTVTSLSPTSGEDGTTLTIYGSGFLGDGGGDVRVWLGEVECEVVRVNESEVVCEVQPHPAGRVAIAVHVPGRGYASVNQSLCFQYTLSVASVLPASGSTEGGTQLTITGRGFLSVSPLSEAAISSPLIRTPWLANGFGWPATPPSSLCPDLTEQYSGFTELTPSESGRGLQELLLSLADSTTDLQESENLQPLLTQLYSTLPTAVYIGTAPCVVTWANLTRLECTTTRHMAGAANVTVRVLGEVAGLAYAYSYDQEETPTVLSIQPASGPVYGGTTITIEGKALYNTLSVSLGDAPCTIVMKNSTHIMCTSTSHAPSLVPVQVVTTSGLAVAGMEGSGGMLQPLSSSLLFRYALEVNAVGPVEGSLLGGLLLTVRGRGFHSTLTTVLIGGRRADITSANDSTVQCIAPPPSQTHTVTFRDEGFDVIGQGFQFLWSPAALEIQRGDTVNWEWNLDRPGSGLVVNVYQTASASSSAPLEGGFSSQSSTEGSFSATFSRTGLYYYASELSQQLVIRGVVNVTAPRSTRANIEVLVSGYTADFVSPASSGDGEGSSMLMPQSEGGQVRRQATGCVEEEQEEVEASPFSLFYSVCSTPTVTSVSPNQGTVLSSFNITGTMLSSPLAGEEPVVQFGGHSCSLLSSTDSKLVCRLDTANLPPSFTPLPLSVTIPGLGGADISTDQTAIELNPIITMISPSLGSTEGGTHVFIYGHGFPAGNLTVQLGGSAECSVLSQTYSQVECVTPPGSEGLVEVTVFLTSDMSSVSWCGVEAGCVFNYTSVYTPLVTDVVPQVLLGSSPITLNITGTLFSSTAADNEVAVGDYQCAVFSATPTFLQCSLDALPAGSYSLSLTVCPSSPSSASYCPGHAMVSAPPLTSPAELSSVTPQEGSVAGGTQLTLSGGGFSSDPTQISVTIGGAVCAVSTASYSQVMCTTSQQSEGMYDVMVTSHGMAFPQTQSYSYSMAMTPTVSTVFPSNGQAGLVVTLSGTNLGGSLTSTPSVQIGGAPCNVNQSASNDSAVVCELSMNLAGQHNVDVSVDGLGTAMSDVTFDYDLQLSSFSPMSGSFAGMSAMVVEGLGFNPTDLSISVCSQPCPLSTTPGSLSQVECILPAMASSGDQLDCGVMVESVGVAQDFPAMFTYDEDLTPVVTSIDRTRGGTQGGSRILITGNLFDGSVNVTIAGVECDILTQTSTEIVCDTGASGRTVRAQVMVFVEGKGFARSENITFWYVDLWSSRFTWGGDEPPREGELVVIPRGQTLVLDTVTPVLGYVIVQGGELVFDPEAEDGQVELHTQGMFISSGGRLQVGTEQDPYLPKTQIVLYGTVLSTEIPVYGAKTLALREGSIDIHGKPLSVTWTRLEETAQAGSTMVTLQEPVDWEVGGKIVIASTSFSQRENEELTITGIDESRTTLTVSPALQYEHIAITQTIEGRIIDTRAEVGYLTRNVVVRGSLNEEWVSEVSACEQEFRPGQFDLQTCFLGRFGNETLSDQFGSQIMIHAAEQSQGDVVGRFSYTEVTHAGQAFRLGRYPIHFHLNGNVSGSYVRGCSIHHTFNRAVTVHGVDYLLVEKNVAYHVLGHAYFLEDGIEENNIIQDNLGVFVRSSSSLLNVDVTPATFWIVNPNNIVRRNAAAGGSHFGFWYRLPTNPTGPSATSSVCPRHIPLGEFSDNSAHSFGWYGLWVSPEYSPREGGSCSSSAPHTPAVFQNFLSWKNDRGVEFEEGGALRLYNSVMLDNRLAGVEVTVLVAEWGGPLIQDMLIVGHSDASAEDDSTCTEAGIKTPHTPYLSVDSVTFVNFDRDNCFPIAACSHCRDLQGGFEARYSNITLVNSPRLTTWQWTHETVHRDLDGSLTGTNQPSLIIPTTEILPPSCTPHAPSSYGIPGSLCPGSLEFVRFALYSPSPASLETQMLNVSNAYGTTAVLYEDKRLLTGDGHMALLPVDTSYGLTWETGAVFTNTSYRLLVSDLPPDNYILLEQPFPEPLDFISVNGRVVNVSESSFDDPAQAQTGDWFSDANNTIHYIVRGEEDNMVDVSFQTYTCFYEDCIPPPPPTLPPPIPPGRPDDTLSWSNSSIWPEGELPEEGEDVFINCTWYVLLDVPIPRLGVLTICGALELLDGMDHTVEADLIIVQGGRLVAGYPDTPFTSKATFLLHGDKSTPEQVFDRGPILGAKALGVFGELVLTSIPRTPTWTTLAATVEAGGDTIVLSEAVEWQPGDEIVVTSTSFEGKQSETAVITAVSNSQRELTLRDPLQYQHVYETEVIGSHSYTIAAEVGLLTRDIVISNGGEQLADEEAFGCRVLVGNIEQDGQEYVGSIQMEGVELRGCGQLGYTNTFDPRFALAILNANGLGSYVRSSSIHDGYNTGIGVFGTNGVELVSNVIHNTVGSSIHATGSNLVVMGNLASLNHFLATYRAAPTAQPANTEWTANYELVSTSNLTLRGNVAAGGGKTGFHVNGDACTSSGDALQVTGNTAHSTLHCWHQGHDDGHPSGCTHISQFTAHSCYHYAIFSYTPAEVKITDCTLVNSNAGIFVSVIGPHSLTHMLGNKEVVIETTVIVSATPTLDCERDSVEPEIALHPQSFSGLRSPSGAHAGVIIPTFVSQPGHRTLSGWQDVTAYPAISGMTTIRDVTFANFGQRCSEKSDVLLVTHASSEDCNHPTHLERITLLGNSDSSLKYYNHNPILGSINPSDCVDLDCDGLKHVLVKDMDGSFTESGEARTMVSMAEIGWSPAGEEGSRGLGNFRIPSVMLASPDGGMEDADQLFPGKGIVRGTGSAGDGSQCSWNAAWNSYFCEGIDHLMLVIESLDEDTEVRRLSPVGLAANGFIDILNGPQDIGWCGGYTCQERISTFFGIVAAGLSYTMALTSTNPQTMALHLLNADEDQAIVIAVFYNNPQRLDVYSNGQYVVPNNAMMLENGNLEYQDGVPSDFIPTLNQPHGSNYYDRDAKKLYIHVRGKSPYEIRTTPVIQVGLSLEVSVDDFFNEDRLVQNIAFLLGIDESQIRVVSVIRETVEQRRRRRQQEEGMERVEVDIEIGNPPQTTISEQNNTSTPNVTTPTNTSVSLSFDQLEEITEQVVDVIQTGQLTSSLNATIVETMVTRPQPMPVDPTNGTRATPETGGPYPDNSTIGIPTFYDRQLEEEREQENETQPIVFTIPTRLVVEQEAGTQGVEGRPLARQPILVMFDNTGEVIENLGLDEEWVVAAVVSSGPEGAFTINTTATLTSGRAQFSSLSLSYPGRYQLSFSVQFPETANFSASGQEEIVITPRDLSLYLATPPEDGNTSFALFPYPTVQLFEGEEKLTQHDWRNSSWYVRAALRRRGEDKAEAMWEEEVVAGEVQFTQIQIRRPGRYSLLLTAFTDPPSSHVPSPITSGEFTVKQLPFTRLEMVFEEDYEEVVGDQEEEFVEAFRSAIYETFPSSRSVEIYNITVSSGSIIVSFFVTSQSASELSDFVQLITTSNDTLVFTFRDTELSPSSITQDTSFPIQFPEEEEDLLLLILASTIPSISLLLLTLIIIITVTICYRRHRNTKVFKVSLVGVSNPHEEQQEARYVKHNVPGLNGGDGESMDSFYLMTEKQLEGTSQTFMRGSAQSSMRSEHQPFELAEKGGSSAYSSMRSTHPPIVTSKQVKVPGGTVFVNLSQQTREEVGDYVSNEKEMEAGIGALQMESSFDEIMNRNGTQHSEDGQ